MLVAMSMTAGCIACQCALNHITLIVGFRHWASYCLAKSCDSEDKRMQPRKT
jgi:hypothetical protein